MEFTSERFQGTVAEWDSFVRSQPGWTHFHLAGWRTVMERVFRHECPYFAARDGQGHLAAVLPLVRVESRLFGRYLVSMPFLNYGGPLGVPAAVKELARSAIGLAGEHRSQLLELRSRIPLDLPLDVSHRKVTVLLDLPDGDPDVLWQRLKAKVRSQVRRPQQEGITVEFGPNQVDPFFEVFARHMRDLGTPTQSRELFRTIAEVFPESVWFGCAYLGGRAVAGGCGFRWQDEFEMTWASSLARFNRVAPNMLLYWRFMERAVGEQVRTFNFGRCTPGGGTHRFKKQWGGRDEPLWWYQFAPSGKGGTPSPDDGAYSWGPRIWRLLPVPVATLLGPRIVRSIP